jgi:outer membrane protein assembly factor BamD (BamD/ComL family)
MVMAQVYSKMKEYDNAINYVSLVWELFEAKFGRNSEFVGRCYLELAKIYLKKKDYNEAISY